MLRSKLPSLRFSRIGKRSQFLLCETLVLLFGVSACTLFEGGVIRWAPLIPCMIGCFASFLLMLTARCDNCDEPVGRDRGRLAAIPRTHCDRCGSDLR
jgi:hypothetical protein